MLTNYDKTNESSSKNIMHKLKEISSNTRKLNLNPKLMGGSTAIVC